MNIHACPVCGKITDSPCHTAPTERVAPILEQLAQLKALAEKADTSIIAYWILQKELAAFFTPARLDALAECVKALEFYKEHMQLGYDISDSGQVATEALEKLNATK